MQGDELLFRIQFSEPFERTVIGQFNIRRERARRKLTRLEMMLDALAAKAFA